MSSGGWTFESADLRSASDEVFAILHAMERDFELEARPDEPPTPFDAFRARYRSTPTYRDSTVWIAFEAGQPIANVTVDFDRTGDNDHVIEAFAYVDPAHRKRGLVRPLLAKVVEAGEADGRTLFMGYSNSRVPSCAAVLQRLGAEEGLVERESELDLRRVDRAMVDRWIAEGPERAGDYEIVVVEDDLPEEFLEPFAALYAVSNSAPRDGLDIADTFRTPEQIREKDELRHESGGERILALARHRPSGDLAGWTELGRHPSEPEKVHQYWTAVHPDHRGHALGKWLKATTVARCFERWPEAWKIVTENAYSNDAMLGINNQLGFEETSAWSVWQLPLADVRKFVEGGAAVGG